MEVVCKNLGKRFQYNWIIRNCNWVFAPSTMIGISGRNGTGKSTFIKLISSQLTPSEGHIDYFKNGIKIERDSLYRNISMVGPYTSLIHEYNLKEQYEFHFKFKRKLFDFTFQEFKEFLDYDSFGHKLIGNYSSGMHQRLQLVLAVLSESPLLLLDEPTSFLDKPGKAWFFNLIEKFRKEKTVIIASNDQEDLDICEKILDIQALKTVS